MKTNIVLKKASYFILPYIIIQLMLVSQSCRIYSFKGTSIPESMKTVTIQSFENGAPMVIDYLSYEFKKALEDRIKNQSRLSLVRTNADANFEGRITDYNIKPTAIQGNDRAGLNRLSITVFVKYTNTVQPAQGFEQSFTRWKDFPTQGRSQQSLERELIHDINAQLTEDIFNRAFVNW